MFDTKKYQIEYTSELCHNVSLRFSLLVTIIQIWVNKSLNRE